MLCWWHAGNSFCLKPQSFFSPSNWNLREGLGSFNGRHLAVATILPISSKRILSRCSTPLTLRASAASTADGSGAASASQTGIITDSAAVPRIFLDDLQASSWDDNGPMRTESSKQYVWLLFLDLLSVIWATALYISVVWSALYISHIFRAEKIIYSVLMPLLAWLNRIWIPPSLSHWFPREPEWHSDTIYFQATGVEG